MNHQFLLFHPSAMREQIFIDLDSAGNIVKAELVVRQLGCRIDVTEAVFLCPEFRERIMTHYYYSEKANEVKRESLST